MCYIIHYTNCLNVLWRTAKDIPWWPRIVFYDSGLYSWLRSLMQRCETTKDTVKISCVQIRHPEELLCKCIRFSFEEANVILEWLKSCGEYSILTTLMGWNYCKSLDKYSTLISSSDISRQWMLPLYWFLSWHKLAPDLTKRLQFAQIQLHRKICIENPLMDHLLVAITLEAVSLHTP